MLVFEKFDYEIINQKMKKIADELKDFSIKSKNISITFSGGVEELKNEDRISMMFSSADKKLYKAKSEGKNRIEFN